jgi:hypothetical protein
MLCFCCPRPQNASTLRAVQDSDEFRGKFEVAKKGWQDTAAKLQATQEEVRTRVKGATRRGEQPVLFLTMTLSSCGHTD